MGSITAKTTISKATGKPVVKFRAYIRREGFASKSKVFAKERDAKDWLRNNDADSTLQRVTSGKTLKALIEKFVDEPPTKGTKYWSAQHLDFWGETLGKMKVAEITRGDINGAKLTLQSRPSTRRTPAGVIVLRDKITPSTVNRYLASLSSVFNFALEHEIVNEHPMKGGKVRKLGEANARTRILSPDEEGRLLDAAKASKWPMLHLFLRVCMTTAARKSEVLRLRWQDVRLADSIAVVDKTKNGRPRALPLVAEVKLALEAAKKVRPLVGDFVFFDERDPSRPKNITPAWNACREAAGLLKDRDNVLDRVYLHTTRHTAVTRMLKGGANLAQAAVVSGHQTLAMLKRYEHLAAADAVTLAEKHLGGGGGT